MKYLESDSICVNVINLSVGKQPDIGDKISESVG